MLLFSPRMRLNRDGLCLLKSLLCFLLFCPLAALAGERPFPNLAAIGSSNVEGAENPQFTPVLFFDYQSPGDPLNFTLKSASLDLKWRNPQGNFYFGPSVRAGWLAEGEPEQIIVWQKRQLPLTFWGHSLQAGLLLGREWAGDLSLELEGVRRQYFFGNIDNTGDSLRLPANFNENRFSLRLDWDQEEDAGWGWRLRSLAEQINRDQWEAWSLEEAVENSQRMLSRLDLAWKGSPAWESKLTLRHAQGRELDFFNALLVGGLAGDIPLGGYYRNEFRAQGVSQGEVTQSIPLNAQGAKVSFIAQGARVQIWENPLYDEMEPSYSLTSAGVGLYYPIQSLDGLPVILSYFEGLSRPQGFPEGKRSEIMILLVAGW